MPITDLTGTKWLFNDTLDGLLYGYFNLNFINEENTDFYAIGSDNSSTLKYRNEVTYVTVYSVSRKWTNSYDKTITITGGTDATNTTLITWFQKYATQIIEPGVNISSFNSMAVTDNEGYITINIGDTSFDFKKYEGDEPITDLTGTKWQINDTTCPAGYGQFNVNFSVTNAYDQTQLLIGYTFNFNTGATPQANTLRVLPNNGELSVGDWISFTGGTDVTNSDLIAWLQEHATQILVNLISFTIGETYYQAEEGMTWAEWVASEYNKNGWYISGNSILNNGGSTTLVASLNDVIVADETYIWIHSGGTGN